VRIEQLMKPAVHTVKPHDSVAHARAILEEHRINQLPVVVNRKLVGIVTDRDLRDAPAAVEVAAETAGGSHKAPPPPPAGAIPVEAVMTTNVLALAPGDSVEEAARLMRRERIGAVPIVDRGALVGIIARSDILDAFVALSEERRKEKGSR
jgi:acetoin utilization protein AcuB